MKLLFTGMLISFSSVAWADFSGLYQVKLSSVYGKCGNILQTDSLNIIKTFDGYEMHFTGQGMPTPIDLVIGHRERTETTYTEFVEREDYLSFMLNHLDQDSRRLLGLQMRVVSEKVFSLTINDVQKDLVTNEESSCHTYFNLSKQNASEQAPPTPEPMPDPEQPDNSDDKKNDPADEGPSIPRVPPPFDDDVKAMA